MTPAACWTASPARPAAGPGPRYSPRPPAIPMALIELATVIADDPAASRRWAAEPLPLTDRLSRRPHLPVRRPARAGAGRAAAGRGGRRPGPERSRQPRGCFRARRAGPRAGRAAGPGHGRPDRRCSFSHPLVRSRHLPLRALRAAAPRRTASSPRARCTTSPTGEPGTWPPRPCNPTSRWPRCWRPPRPRRNTAAARPPPRWRWNARPNSAPNPGTRHAGWSPPPRPPFPPARPTGSRILPPAPSPSPRTTNCG